MFRKSESFKFTKKRKFPKPDAKEVSLEISANLRLSPAHTYAQ